MELYHLFIKGHKKDMEDWVVLRVVARGRIELPTRGFSVHCSTD